jgi:hypothetical protein
MQSTRAENLLDNQALLGASVHPLLPEMLASAYAQIRPTPENGPVFTDDRAAVELLTDSILVNFVLGGGSELPCQ